MLSPLYSIEIQAYFLSLEEKNIARVLSYPDSLNSSESKNGSWP